MLKHELNRADTEHDRRSEVTEGRSRTSAISPQNGLTSQEAQARLGEYGPNRLVPERRRLPVVAWLLRPLADPMVVLLLIAGTTYFILGDHFDALAILVALVPIFLVTLILETRAERALEKLKRLTAPMATVWRDGERTVISAEEIVPRDLVVIQEGDVVPADGVLVEGAQIMIDESALTGESQPVVKDADGMPANQDIWAGTTVRSGRGTFRVTATGLNTRYGQIGELVADIRQPETPLQRRIRWLIWQFAAGAVVVCLFVGAVELLSAKGWAAAIIAAVSLGIAAIPEEFPMVYTLYLTLGAWRLTREHALVRRLSSVETLGATTVICVDKTGTLTLGRMDVAALSTEAGVTRAGEEMNPRDRELVRAAVLASEPGPFDPLEQAIVRFAESQGIDVQVLDRETLIKDYAFDPSLKYMSHVWQVNGACRIAAKGATEGILARSHTTPRVRQTAIELNQALASEGLRVVAVAGGTIPRPTGDRSDDESHLKFLGLIAFSDPVRPGVADALRQCRDAGIRVIMITGDHPVTAHAVAEGLGLPHSDKNPVVNGDALDHVDAGMLDDLLRQTNIFARIRPEQKYGLVKALRTQGQVVAMTGDGINDAPALRESDIGVAMGQRGTEVARESADLVLLDDNFATIVTAVREGRRIFENLRRAFSYLIAFHTPLLLAALIVPLMGAPLLLLPVTLIWLELVVHPTASLVFENDPPPADLMKRSPRSPGAGLLAATDFSRALVEGLSLFAVVLAIYLSNLAQGATEAEARAVAITTLFLGQMLLVLVERSGARPLWQTGFKGNRALAVVLVATLSSLLIALYVSPVAALMKFAPITVGQWSSAAAGAALALLWLEPLKRWRPHIFGEGF
jgi:Ca2+-transporting ATPase